MRRETNVLRVCLIVAAAVIQYSSQAAEPHRYLVAPPPDWVKSAPSQRGPGESAPREASAGTEYLLSDRQIRVDGGWSEYFHYVMRATNASGVSDISQITIDFDPELDRLFLHSVALHRGNQTIDELQRGRVEVLQRESELEKGILDGSLTFHLVMSDVRVGDSVDYSFTIEHRDLAWGNRFFGRYVTQWPDPIDRSRLRILARTQVPIYLRYQPHQEPTRADDGTWQTLEWVAADVPAIAEQKDTPSWYEQYPAIQVSQFGSWKELVDAALPLYTLPAAPSRELAALEKRLSSSAHSDSERALAAVRFVQEEIRYTGLELGSGAYRPTPPGEVLMRRYGDCKDKTMLAVALLRDLGIDAAPALVSPRWGHHLHERLPSPDDFSHAVTKMRIGSKTYWLDMTATAQGGELENLIQADFGEALVIAPGVSALEEIRSQSADRPLVSSDVEFDLRAGLDKEASLTVTTVYRDSEADDLRLQLRRETLAELGTSYLNYYKGRYATIRALTAPHVVDDFRANEITVTESYRIDRPFEVADSGKKQFEVEAEIINEHLHAPSTPMRTLPLALDNPVNSSERITVRMPEVFPVKDETVTIEDTNFHYESRVSHAGNDVLLDYSYRTLRDSVPHEGMEEFLRKRAEARKDTYLRFTKNVEEKQPSTKAAEALKLLARAAQLVQGGEMGKTDDVLKELLPSEGFQSLTAEQQHAAVYLAGVVALERDPERALELLTRASGMDKAATGDWALRLRAAILAHNPADATLSLTTLAQRWPEALSDIDSVLVARTVHNTPNTDPGRYGLLSALFDAKYTAEGLEPSDWWRDLALLQLRRGEQSAAAKSLDRLTDPYALISVRADSRFAPIRGRAALDIPAAVDRQIRAARDVVKGHPGKLRPVIQLVEVLVQALHFDEALRIADETISAMHGPKGPKVYDDYRTFEPWLLDSRSRALYGLGRWDEAVTQLQAAIHLPESGNANVSQVINLAGLYNDLGKPTEARAELAGLVSGTLSPYGLMQAAIERVSSADQLGDSVDAERQLEFLREHREDSVATYQRALVSVNHLDEAAQLLISRLQNPDQRLEALVEIQQYQGYRSYPGRAAEWQRRWKAVRERPDVRDAIAKVGNIGLYPLLAR
jgi:hypothetical protein